MNITYTIDLCYLYDNNFCTGYSKIFDENNNVLTDEIWGYLDYKIGNLDDRKRVEEETRNKIGEYLNEVINNNKIDINEYKKIMNDLDIKYIKLNDVKYICKDGVEYTLTRIINMETNECEGVEMF